MARTYRKASYGEYHSTFEGFYADRRHRMFRLFHTFGKGDPIERLEKDEAEHRSRWARRHRDNAASKLHEEPFDRSLYRDLSKSHIRKEARMRLRRAIKDGEWDGLVLPERADGKRYKHMCAFEW